MRDRALTGVLAVALPEEILAGETLELEARLYSELGMAIDAIVVNAVYPQRFSGEEARRLDALTRRASPPARAALRAAPRSIAGPAPRLPGAPPAARVRGAGGDAAYLFEPELGPGELERLSRELERRL